MLRSSTSVIFGLVLQIDARMGGDGGGGAGLGIVVFVFWRPSTNASHGGIEPSSGFGKGFEV